MNGPLIGVLALQGAFEEHEQCLRSIGCRTVQVRNVKDMEGLDGIILPGGESTAMGLIGTASSESGGGGNGKTTTLWESLREFRRSKPVWGTCAGMILLAEKCVGTSAVIENGQSLIGGVDITVARNYFGSQISSFEMDTPPPPPPPPPLMPRGLSKEIETNCKSISMSSKPFPGVFIRAPAILSAGPDVEVLGRVVATPCRQAAVTLAELERKIAAGENVVKMMIVDALDRTNSGCDGSGMEYIVVMKQSPSSGEIQEEKKAESLDESGKTTIVLPGAADGTNAREVICAARKDNILCTAFHPELTDDYRWHRYFAQMVREATLPVGSP